ncbi:MAG: DNA mismatch repair endonuclease MutL [Nanoarchaeota archaeon]|nr:DNA mismatch repair endonuclease MutL [Nanoarchaeota archaeon]
MGKVHVLDEVLINKIAAGEVIERPAAVVKELIENSIDAGADQISITIGEGGKSYIKVHDNGCGMAKEDVVMSIQRHATSKIEQSEDLFAINTLGFRGEALASIAAVSRMRIITRNKESEEGTQIDMEGFKIRSIKEIACPSGTIVEVSSLFYNTPARKKYMKAISSEHNAIVDIVTRYGLAYKNIFFKLYHGKKLVLNCPKTPNMLNNIVSIYGSELGKNLLKLNYKSKNLKLKGYVSKPSMTRGDKSQQSIFLNGRYIRNKAISSALYEGYHSLLFTGRHPIAVLFIDMDITKVDVNVHPTKDIVRIENEDRIYNDLKYAITSILESANLIPSAGINFNPNVKATKMYDFAKDKQKVLETKEVPAAVYVKDNDAETKTEVKNAEESDIKIKDIKAEDAKSEDAKSERIGAYRILGQLNRTYIIAENPAGLLLIDQHAAEERVNYEILMEEYKHKGIKVQQLVKPKIIELTPAESNVIKANLELLKKAGFEFEEYGSNSFRVRTIPAIFGRFYDGLMTGLIRELDSISTKKIESIKEERIIRFACRKSIKAGKELTLREMENLMRHLDKTKQPFSCPHGRPTIISVTIGELEKKFKRVG